MHNHPAHHHHHHGSSEQNIAVAFFLNAFFVIVEVVGGLFTNSIAILSDALHDFGDCLSLGVAWALQRKSGQGRDGRYSYGYKRFSLLGSLFLSGILAVSSVFIVTEAVKRIIDPQPVAAGGMIWIAVFGILINGAAALRVKRGTSLNERAVFLHIMEDALGWVAVLVASITMHFVEIPVLDPILSLAITVWVVSNVFANLRSVFKVLLQGIPENVPMDEFKTRLEAIDGVISVHDLHVWSLDGESGVMSVHVVTGLPLVEETAAVKKDIVRLAGEYEIRHVTAEFEAEGSCCTTNCDCPD